MPLTLSAPSTRPTGAPMIEEFLAMRDSPPVLSYSKEVPIVQAVQIVSGVLNDLNRAQRLNGA
jgi:hypothetical protein